LERQTTFDQRRFYLPPSVWLVRGRKIAAMALIVIPGNCGRPEPNPKPIIGAGFKPAPTD
jgi:hypothetical protein